jgi:hypothetical protein
MSTTGPLPNRRKCAGKWLSESSLSLLCNGDTRPSSSKPSARFIAIAAVQWRHQTKHQTFRVLHRCRCCAMATPDQAPNLPRASSLSLLCNCDSGPSSKPSACFIAVAAVQWRHQTKHQTFRALHRYRCCAIATPDQALNLPRASSLSLLCNGDTRPSTKPSARFIAIAAVQLRLQTKL